MRGDPLWDYVDSRLDADTEPHIIEPEDLLGLTDHAAEGTDRSVLRYAACCEVAVDFIDASDAETECATAGDTPLLLRIAVTDDITQRTNTIKE